MTAAKGRPNDGTKVVSVPHEKGRTKPGHPFSPLRELAKPLLMFVLEASLILRCYGGRLL